MTAPQRRPGMEMTWGRFLKDEQEFPDINISGGEKEKDTPRQREQHVHDSHYIIPILKMRKISSNVSELPKVTT